MFKKPAIQMTMVSTKQKDSTEPTQGCSHDPEKIAEIVKDIVTHTAKAVGAVVLTWAAATALTIVADNLTKNDDRK